MKLTNTIRQAILQSALTKAGIPARQAAIRHRYADWAEAVRVRYVTPEVVAAIGAAKQASEAVPVMFKRYSFKPELRAMIDVNVAGQRRRYYWNGEVHFDKRQEDDIRICPDENATLTADDPLTEQLYAIDHDAAAMKSETEQLTASVNAVLYSVTTDKKLIEVWPEAVAFIPAAERASSPQLPALPIDELNRMIGLP